jgi:hypothetical protein
MTSPSDLAASTPPATSRWKAFGIHLSISALIATVVVSTMYFVWYPDLLFEAMGASGLVLIIIGVDVVLGPLITLIVFNPAKEWRVLRMDLAMIALAQAGALAYGVYVVAEARPVYVVFSVDRFDAVAANDLHDVDLAKVTRPEFRSVPWGRPRVIAVEMPADSAAQLEVIQWGAAGLDLQMFPQYYRPYADLAALALKRARPLSELRQRHPDEVAKLDAALAKLGRRDEETVFLPLKARNRDVTVLLDAKSGAVAGFAEVNPW